MSTVKERKAIYVCHAYSGDPVGNAKRVVIICRVLTACGYLPVAPHFYLREFVDENKNREEAMELCLNLLELCDEVWVYGEPTDGMKQEIAFAKELGIPLRNQ